MSQELIDSVNGLTSQTTALLQEYKDAKVNIDGKVSNASSSASAAHTSAGQAATSASNASSHSSNAYTYRTQADSAATRAETAAATAEQVAGLDTVDQAVDLALSNRRIGWRTEADMTAMIAENKAKYVAGGFSDFGLALNGGAATKVNEGLWSYEDSTWTNFFTIGRAKENDGVGKSDNEAPTIYMLGYETELGYMRSASSPAECRIRFPEAEKGYNTFDRATGERINHRTDVSQFYGDVAADHNEAVCRAFEFSQKNFDMRKGDDGTWAVPPSGGTVSFANSVATVDFIGGNTRFGSNYDLVGLSDDEEVRIKGKIRLVQDADGYASVSACIGTGYSSVGGFPTYQVKQGITVDDGWVEFDIPVVIEDAARQVAVLLAFDGTWSNAQLEVDYLTVKKESVDVTINREDLWGMEGFLEEITPTNPYVYWHGLVHSIPNDINGITTEYSNRNDTYYAQFEGDTDSRGKGVNFLALTPEEQDLIAMDAKNHIYLMADGTLVQWRVRSRTIAGLGNGKWFSKDSTQSYLGVASEARLCSHGAREEARLWSPSHSTIVYYGNAENANPQGERQLGLFTNYSGLGTSPDAKNGQLAFMVCAWVPRLNQGVWMPNMNEMGTANGTSPHGTNKVAEWTESCATVCDLYTLADCFKSGNGYAATEFIAGRYSDTGSIKAGSTYNGVRPDARFHDIIYPEGLGGIVDMRITAQDVGTLEKHQEVKEAVRVGGYRGKEELPFSQWKLEEVGFRNRHDFVLHNNSTTLRTRNKLDGGIVADYKGDDMVKYRTVYTDSAQTDFAVFEFRGNDQEMGRSWSRGAQLNKAYWLSDGSSIDNGTPGIGISGALKQRLVLNVEESDSDWDFFSDLYVLDVNPSGIEVSGSVLIADVSGKVHNIVDEPATKEGWLGNYLLTDFTNASPMLTRKSYDVDTVTKRIYKELGDESWKVAGLSVSNENNTVQLSMPSFPERMNIVYYHVNAKETKPCGNVKVLHGSKGVGEVYTSQSYSRKRSTMMESLSGHINVFNGNDTYSSISPLRCFTLTTSGKLYHTADSRGARQGEGWTSLVLSTSNGQDFAVKMIDYVSVESTRQCNLRLAYNVLYHNGSTWVDDSFVRITDNEAVSTNADGDLCLYGTHELAIPYGFSLKESN